MLSATFKPVSSVAWMFPACLALVLTAPVRVDAQPPYERIVVFGTSLSDPGNAFALTGNTSTPPDYSLDPFLVPSAAYSRGGHHLSNGATWIEQLARSLSLAGTVRPAFQRSNSGATNYAVGGARARDDGINLNLSTQVKDFLQEFGGVAPSNALYVVEMGSNDVGDALMAISGGGNGGAIIGAALTSIANSIGVLHAAGARNFLVLNVPNIGLTPAIHIRDSLNPGAAQLATQLSQTFNANLANVLGQLSALPGINIVPFDAYGLISHIAADPAAFGITNVTAACVTPFVPPFACNRPDEFLFWDGIHPTKAVHAIIAEEAALAVSP